MNYKDFFKQNPASEFVFYRTYARWLPEKQRRESWEETINRYCDFIFTERDTVPEDIKELISDNILNMKVMPSMRALWSAGKPAKQNNLAMYNCSYVAVDSLKVFGEAIYVLMHGAGLGFSVEQRFITKLPEVPELHGGDHGIYRVEDSKEGWKASVDNLFNSFFKGYKIEFDYSQVRPKGAKLKTFGGRASGPGPLKELHIFIKKKLHKAQGRQLTDLECHDILCKIGEIVVVGGVRRTACISFSDLTSVDMRHAKDHPIPTYRFMSNNSAVYEEKPPLLDFLEEWVALAKSGTGERGIANFSNIAKYAPRRHINGHVLRANPCMEAILRDMGLCNLTEVVIRHNDTWDDLLDKIKVAVWLGVIQSTFTDFPNIRKDWKRNAEEERLLGVSLTGQCDNLKLLTPETLEKAKGYAIKVAKKAAKHFGINVPVQVTLSKPSGTVGQLVNSSSGSGSRHSQYQIRRYRISADDPLCHLLRDSGVILNPENGMTEENATVYVASFYLKAPRGSITRDQFGAMEQLEHYKKVQNNWCEGNVSTTIYVKDDEWLEVGAWVHKNFDDIIGIAFLPFDGGVYEQAPNEEITKEQYEKFMKKFPKIDYSRLSEFEDDDNTTGAQERACVGGSCEIDLPAFSLEKDTIKIN